MGQNYGPVCLFFMTKVRKLVINLNSYCKPLDVLPCLVESFYLTKTKYYLASGLLMWSSILKSFPDLVFACYRSVA